MKITRRDALCSVLGVSFATSMTTHQAMAEWQWGSMIEGTDEFLTAVDAYIYGYPLVTMEMTRRVATNVAAPEGNKAPMGQLIKFRTYPDASFKDVTAPNADTLYTSTFLDVGKEPWIMGIPDMKGRYYLFPLLDGWTNVFQVPGKRTTGTGAQTYAITGPGWSGTLPNGVKQLKSPTSLVWLIARMYCTGTKEDYAEVHALQDQVQCYPLSSYGKPYTPPPGTVDPSIDLKTPVRDQVNAMDAVQFFTLLADLMKTNPPAPEDASAVAKFASIGLVPGRDFDKSKFDPILAKRIPTFAQHRIMAQFVTGKYVKNKNGWMYDSQTGLYGTDYLNRAFLTYIGLGANRNADAVYPTSQRDYLKRKYSGAHDYTITFPKGQLPPVNGFWSVTMYDENYFFVANPINRYSISPRQSLKTNPDGSTTLYIQNASPGSDKESNWLPAPKDDFVLMLRMYWPKENKPSILDGSWQMPAVKRV